MSNSLPLPVRWVILLLAFGALWAVVYGFGVVGVPAFQGIDQAISAALNPDHYAPGFDEFFRALTDYSNFLIPMPFVSWMVAFGLYRFTKMDTRRAVKWGVGACVLWWLVLGLIHDKLDIGMGAAVKIAVATPLLILLGGVLPRLVPRLDAKRWLCSLLAGETLLLVALWFAHKLWWNNGLYGANLLFLPALVLTFGGATYVFYRMDDAAMLPFARVFWLVLLTIVLVDPIGTEITKGKIARPRPLNDLNKPWNEQLRPIPEELLRGKNSYPSGHTSGTFALLTPLFWFVRDRRARVGIFSWAALQGVARVYTVAHFTSDCVMGGLLGFGTGTLIFFLLGGPALRAPATAKASAV